MKRNLKGKRGKKKETHFKNESSRWKSCQKGEKRKEKHVAGALPNHSDGSDDEDVKRYTPPHGFLSPVTTVRLTKQHYANV